MLCTRNMKIKIIENNCLEVNVPHLSFNKNLSKGKILLIKMVVTIKEKR